MLLKGKKSISDVRLTFLKSLEQINCTCAFDGKRVKFSRKNVYNLRWEKYWFVGKNNLFSFRCKERKAFYDNLGKITSGKVQDCGLTAWWNECTQQVFSKLFLNFHKSKDELYLKFSVAEVAVPGNQKWSHVCSNNPTDTYRLQPWWKNSMFDFATEVFWTAKNQRWLKFICANSAFELLVAGSKLSNTRITCSFRQRWLFFHQMFGKKFGFGKLQGSYEYAFFGHVGLLRSCGKDWS